MQNDSQASTNSHYSDNEIDFVCRPHATDHCWELGYVEDGKLFGRDYGTCNDQVMKEFNLAIKIENGRGKLIY